MPEGGKEKGCTGVALPKGGRQEGRQEGRTQERREGELKDGRKRGTDEPFVGGGVAPLL